MTGPSLPRPMITSTANPRIKAVVRLRDRRVREATGLTVVDGAREVARALAAGADLVETYLCEPLLAGPEARRALDAIEAAGAPIHRVSEHVLGALAFGSRTDGLVAVVGIPDHSLAHLPVPDDALFVVAEGIEKPGNLGAILRSIDGAGGSGLIAASPGTDLFNPNTVRASVATVFSVPTAAAETADVIRWLEAADIRVVAARVDGARRYTEVDLTGRVAIALGAEADGLTGAWSRPRVEAVHVPMLGAGDSLNVSVTAAILLYEARRQRDEAATAR